MSTVNEKMTELADECRKLFGTTEKLSVENIINKIKDANDFIVSFLTENDEEPITLIDYYNENITALKKRSFTGNLCLHSIHLPNCTILESYFTDGAFSGCKNLTTVNLPLITIIDTHYSCFRDCVSLENIHGLKFAQVPQSCFQGCHSLKEVDCSMTTEIHSTAFKDCYELSNMNLPLCTSLGPAAFENTNKLKTIYLPSCTSIEYQCFKNSGVIELYLLNENKVCEISTFSLQDSLFEENNYDGPQRAIYVPWRLLDKYKKDENWSYYTDFIFEDPNNPRQVITFTINGITYQSMEEMTWEEWCASSYNTYGYYTDDMTNYIKNSNNEHISTDSNGFNHIYYDKIIQANGVYYWVAADDNEPV